MAGRSLKLFTLFGIRVGVSTSWFVILFLLLYLFTRDFESDLGLSTSGAFAVALAAAILFFGSILLHELGHAWRPGGRASRSRASTCHLGGVMRMSREGIGGRDVPDRGGGPAVTLALVVVGGALGAALLGWGQTVDADSPRGQGGTTAPSSSSAPVALNVILLLFNLSGAPLDGGQILKAPSGLPTGDRSRHEGGRPPRPGLLLHC